MFSLPRVAQFALPLLALFGVPVPAAAQRAAPAPAATAAQSDPWLYRGSDIPHDPEWKFGVLPNGVRYAVRKNGVPPGQVAIRVRMDVGSLMEKDSERGYAHLIEHLSFRGSEYVSDMESKRIWQRLGVTFGSDTNAQTTFTQTVYQLDLPSADQAGLDESFKILSGMMAKPTLSQEMLNAERPVVLAEGREQPGPQVRLQDAMFGLIFAGQPLAERKPIGTPEALNAATPASVQAFHDRWYRPERATIVAVGDVDPALLEQLITKYFSAWKGEGPEPAKPDFGAPTPDHPTAATLVEPALPPMVMMATERPWTVFADTIIFNQKRFVDLIAIRIINRRLESRARSGASYIGAQASLDDIARSANVTTVQILPQGPWETALKDVREVIADAIATPPTQAEIDREVAEIDAALKNEIATEPVEAGAKIADTLVQAVDINETTTNAQASYDIFKGAVDKHMFTPEAVQASSKRVFQGVATRAIVNLHAPDPQALTKLTAALTANVNGAAAKRKVLGDVSFAKLPALGAPGTIASRTTLVPQPRIEKIVFSNGVTLLLHENKSEVNKVYVNVRFGRGLSGLPANRPSLVWSGEAALVASGIGSYGQEELDALMGPRQMGFDFDVGEDAFSFNGQTTQADLADQLKLFATKLAAPGWDPNPVARVKAAMLAGYAGLTASPDAVLSRELEAQTHSGDPRWTAPNQAQIAALTPAAFKAFWAPQLAAGPIEVDIFGDIDSEAAVASVAATFGALPPRTAEPVTAAPVKFPVHVTAPIKRTHTGQPDQAAAVIAWPTGAGSAGIAESRKLQVLAAIFRDRLLDQLRSQAGVSYSPNVVSQWPLGLPGGGKIMALGLVPPAKTDFFFQLARGIAADLASKPVDADELNRALTPMQQQIIRASTGNPFWMQLVQGSSVDPVRASTVLSVLSDVARTTPAELQALAAKYLRPEADWTMVVVPKAAKPAPKAPAKRGRK